LAEDLADRRGEQRGHVVAFFRALALCHTVLADKPNNSSITDGVGGEGGEKQVLNYKAESPDEAALVSAARDAGFPFLGKRKDNVDIEVMGQLERYALLKVLEFNSTRKRMSVIVRTSEGKLILYCKGADSVIYARLSSAYNNPSHPSHTTLSEVKDQTTKDMEMFANNGLRTLCIAYRELEEEEYLQWVRVHDAATSAVENREEEIEKANERIERELVILGATALEDKLQEGVPEAIEMLHRAGIKLWILTGEFFYFFSTENENGD
jgi:phospholipid-translocating ATPase